VGHSILLKSKGLNGGPLTSAVTAEVRGLDGPHLGSSGAGLLVHHVTSSGNSVWHTFASRPFKTIDRSRNHWLVGLLAIGEGWHNNHHAFPRSAIHGHGCHRPMCSMSMRGMERCPVSRFSSNPGKFSSRAQLLPPVIAFDTGPQDLVGGPERNERQHAECNRLSAPGDQPGIGWVRRTHGLTGNLFSADLPVASTVASRRSS
jgi:hypothetical protein